MYSSPESRILHSDIMNPIVPCKGSYDPLFGHMMQQTTDDAVRIADLLQSWAKQRKDDWSLHNVGGAGVHDAITYVPILP